MPDYKDILYQFKKNSLQEMDGVKLMDRTDTKFSFRKDQLSNILHLIRSNYTSLEINEKRIARYHTLYYDTPGFELYLKHHNGVLNRYKIRHRTYIDSNLAFLEVKFKNNKGRTVKTRISKLETPTKFDNDMELFLKNIIPFDPTLLVPAVWVNYNRITLVSTSTAERLTIDTDLEFIKNDRIIKMDNLVIAEVKQNSKQSSPFIKLMKDLFIYEGGISKYCLAISKTNKSIKQNSFKPKLINLEKILNYVPSTSF